MDILMQRLSSKIEEHNGVKGGAIGDDEKRLFTAESIANAAISLENEKMSLRVFVDLLNDALSAYPTSYDFDKSLLDLHELEYEHDHCSNGGSLEVSGAQVNVDHLHGMSHNKRNAVVCRLGEKKVLKHYIHMAETALRYISEVCEGGTEDTPAGNSDNHVAMAEKEILAQYNALLAETLQSR
jgi:hypothetical protein